MSDTSPERRARIDRIKKRIIESYGDPDNRYLIDIANWCESGECTIEDLDDAEFEIHGNMYHCPPRSEIVCSYLSKTPEERAALLAEEEE